MDWTQITPELQKKLDPKHIKPAPRGKFGDYVDGYHVISEANRIFGEENWSYEITRLELVSEQTVELKGNKGPYEQYRVGYLCTVKVRVGDSFKEGAAVGSGVGSPNTVADHHESAVKEAETDALKRALRSYGNTFGLALYDKDKANVGVEEQPFNSVEMRDRLKGAIENIQDAVRLDKFWNQDNTKDAFGKLKPPHQAEIQKAYTDRMALVYQAPPEGEAA